MKFCKTYQEFMQEQQEELPGVGFKKLKKILKKCRKTHQSQSQSQSQSLSSLESTSSNHSSRDDNHNALLLHSSSSSSTSTCTHQCPVCDGTFFSPLLNEMSAIVGCFNERAQKLLELHLVSGFRKHLVWLECKRRKSHGALIQEGKDLVTYAMINAIAVRKILKKYDKVHYSKQGQAFKSQAQSLHMEILQSPWLCELIAFHINLRETTGTSSTVPGLFEGFSVSVKDDKPSLSCSFLESIKLDIELTCSICLDTVFDSVSLTCGHIFCYMCACSSASVTIVDGLKAADPRAKCPLCREAGVYEGAVHLEELNILLSRSCREYWEERLQSERVERIKQAKEHWESQCRAFMGV